MIKELLKYPSIENIHYVELNPALFKLAEKYAPLPEDKRIHIIYGDARRYLNHNKASFDIAVMALPDPASLQINRLYSQDFVQLLKEHLNPGAVIIYGISPTGNYMSSSKLRLDAAIYNTLSNNFKNVCLIPGERDYFLASDADISIAITELYNRHSIENTYVNAYYIDDALIEQRSNAIINSISQESVINTDNKPQPVYFNIVHFMSQFNLKLWLVLVVPVILLLIPFSRSTSVSKVSTWQGLLLHRLRYY
jgi:spermidine synthase